MFWRKKNNKHRFELKLKHKGHRFYVPGSPEELNSSRAIGYWDAIHQFALRITYNDLDSFSKLMHEYLNKQDFAGMAYLTKTLDIYRSLEMSRETLFTVGNQLIFIDGEKNEALNPDYSDLKKELFMKYDEVKGFFLSSSWRSIKDSTGLSNDMAPEDYLSQEEIKKIGQMFFNSISKNGSLSSRNELTNLYS